MIGEGKVSIIVPVYGEGFNPKSFVGEIKRELYGKLDFEIIFVNEKFSRPQLTKS